MSTPRAYTYLSTVFFLAAVVFMVTGNTGTGAAFIALGAVFIALGQTPPKNDKNDKNDEGGPRGGKDSRPPSA